MKKIIFFFFGLTALSYMSCNTDNPTPAETAPVVDFKQVAGSLSADATVSRNTIFKVTLTAAKGTKSLKTLTIRENGKAILDFNSVVVGGQVISANPILLFGADKDGFSFEIGIVSADTAGVNTYSFFVEDEGSLSDEASLVITTPGKKVTEFTSLKMSNKNGPDKSGINLETGNTVLSSDATADIIDIGNATASSNWLKRVFGQHGTNLRVPTANLDYDKINYVDQLQPAYDDGSDSPNNDLEMFEGTIFIAKTAANKYYVVKVTKVQITSSDNTDYVLLSVKKD